MLTARFSLGVVCWVWTTSAVNSCGIKMVPSAFHCPLVFGLCFWGLPFLEDRNELEGAKSSESKLEEDF